MDEIIEELPTDILEKEYKDLTDSEKAKIVLELNRFALSDFWTKYQEELSESAIAIEADIEKLVILRKEYGPVDPVKSQFDRDLDTYDYMQETIKRLTDESLGCAIFRNKLEAGAKAYRKQAMERIESGYDAPIFSEIDMAKNDRALRLSVKVWLQQTINSYEKVTEAPEVKSAY